MLSGPEKILALMAWENAKGALRASVMTVAGKEALNANHQEQINTQWMVFSEKVETFISEIEDDALNE